jgi:hypothetical protein
VIYLPNPMIGVRGIYEEIVSAFGQPVAHLGSRLMVSECTRRCCLRGCLGAGDPTCAPRACEPSWTDRTALLRLRLGLARRGVDLRWNGELLVPPTSVTSRQRRVAAAVPVPKRVKYVR